MKPELKERTEKRARRAGKGRLRRGCGVDGESVEEEEEEGMNGGGGWGDWAREVVGSAAIETIVVVLWVRLCGMRCKAPTGRSHKRLPPVEWRIRFASPRLWVRVVVAVPDIVGISMGTLLCSCTQLPQ